MCPGLSPCMLATNTYGIKAHCINWSYLSSPLRVLGLLASLFEPWIHIKITNFYVVAEKKRKIELRKKEKYLPSHYMWYKMKIYYLKTMIIIPTKNRLFNLLLLTWTGGK
jgi:hypothetical protein